MLKPFLFLWDYLSSFCVCRAQVCWQTHFRGFWTQVFQEARDKTKQPFWGHRTCQIWQVPRGYRLKLSSYKKLYAFSMCAAICTLRAQVIWGSFPEECLKRHLPWWFYLVLQLQSLARHFLVPPGLWHFLLLLCPVWCQIWNNGWSWNRFGFNKCNVFA